MDADNFNMVIEDENGIKKECSIIARWKDIFDYVAYTDGTKTDGELDLFINRCQINDDGTIKLIAIQDDDEWKKVNDFLDHYLYEEGEK